MARKRHTPDEIISKLREAEIALAGGQSVGSASRQLGISEHTYCRRRSEYGGMRVDQARRLKDLESENTRLKHLLADAELDEAILREAASVRF